MAQSWSIKAQIRKSCNCKNEQENKSGVGHIWHQKSLQAFSQAFQDTALSCASPTALPGVLVLKGRRVIDI